MPVTSTIRACERCGAIVAIRSPEGGGIDNEQGHLGWHKRQDELLKVLMERALSSPMMRLRAFLWRRMGQPVRNITEA